MAEAGGAAAAAGTGAAAAAGAGAGASFRDFFEVFLLFCWLLEDIGSWRLRRFLVAADGGRDCCSLAASCALVTMKITTESIM